MNHQFRRSRDANWLVASLLISICAPASVAEEVYDPPRYCQVEALRGDASLRAIDFQSAQLGIAVGAHGAILRTEDGGATWQQMESTVPYQLDDVAFLDERRVVAVGGVYDPVTHISRGVVVFSHDGGRRWWRAADQELPRLRSIEVQRDGTLLVRGDWSSISLDSEFSSSDGGQTFKPTAPTNKAIIATNEPTAQRLSGWLGATGVPVVIRDAIRTASGRLWAVGDHGVILTQPTPQSAWEVSHGRGNRTAVLMISRNATTVAWSLLGREAMEAGNRTALLLIGNEQNRDRDSTHTQLDLVRQAACNMAVSSVDLVQRKSPEDLPERLSTWISAHQPAAVVIDATLDPDLRAALAKASISAGAGRIIQYSLANPGGSLLHHSAILPGSGVLASDLWRDAMQLVAPHDARVHTISLRNLYDAGIGLPRGTSVASGLRLTRGQGMQAKTETASRRQLQISQARINHSRQIDELIHQSASESEFAERLKAFLDQTAHSDQRRLAWMIYQQLAGNESAPIDLFGFHRAMLLELESRFKGSSLAWYAKLRRQAISHSREWQRLKAAIASSSSRTQVQTAGAEVVPVSPFQIDTNPVRQAAATIPLKIVDTTPVDATPQISRDFIDLNWEFHPLALVSREAARRRGDDEKLQAAGEISANLRRLLGAGDGAWARLLRSAGPHVIAAHDTELPPKLDGVADDACWQVSPSVAGNSPRLRCAYDDQYLYLAISTPVEAFADDAEFPTTARIRDLDLSSVDRTIVSIDTDTDLLTSFDFQFTRRGRTHDAVDGNPGWQPTWYVASRKSGANVFTELAILRRDLVDLPIVAGESWFISTRTLAAGQATFFQVMPSPSNWHRIVFH